MADKYLYYNPTTGKPTSRELTVTSSGSGDAGKGVALGSDGKLDPSVIAGSSVTTMQASESISAGKYVNIFDNGGAIRIRLADAANGYEAHGFALATIGSGSTGAVQLTDASNTLLSGLTLGVDYFLGNAGGVIVAASLPTSAGSVCQKLGRAKSATELVGRIDTGFYN